MAKWIKRMLVMVFFTMVITTTLYGFERMAEADIDNVPGNYPYVETLMLESSRYTQPDDVDPAVMSDYETLFTLAYDELDLETLGFVKMLENDDIELYFEVDSFSVMVRNKTTGYLWSSRPEFQGISGNREDNTSNRNLMNSGLWVTYGRSAKITSSTIQTESLYTIADVSYQTNGAIMEGQEDPLSPFLIEEDSYQTNRVENTIVNARETAFDVQVNIKSLGFQMTVSFALDGASFDAAIQNQSIIETNETYTLLSVSLFPYLGAAREDKIPGYAVIPDGVGALVRLDRAHNALFQARFYGADAGYNSTTLPELSVPIFGLVHRVGGNAFYAEVTEGSENTQLIAQFWGDNSRYHRIHSRFSVRQIFRTIINKAGDGNDAVSEQMTTSDYRINYRFMSNDEASYVGIAADYRDHLIARDVLSQREKVVDGSIPLHTSYITGDQEPAFIGTSHVEMTTPSEMLDRYQSFKDAGITNQQVTVYGWSKDGFVYRAPYRTRIHDERDFKTLFETITGDQNTVYLENEYLISTELSTRVSYNRDVARNLSRLKMSYTRRDLNGNTMDIYYLIPESSYRMAKDDQSFFEDLGITGLQSGNLGHTLFSTYDDGVIYERSQGIRYYDDILSLYDGWLLSRPNSLVYQHLNGYLDMPITNSQFDYYTDLIPLIPIILKGSLSYYTPYLNFNALGDDRLLMMVDFGINPSYVLTEEPTYEMRYTNASMFFTTEANLYQESIIGTYDWLNTALSPVINAKIEAREILQIGLSKVTYDNGVVIYVNYTNNDLIKDGITIEARGYEVIMP